MQIIKHNPLGLFPQYRCYTHAVEIRGGSRLLMISGLNGYLKDGKTMPESFEEQADVIWTHIGTLLRSAGMEFNNLVSLRTYLAVLSQNPGIELGIERTRAAVGLQVVLGYY